MCIFEVVECIWDVFIIVDDVFVLVVVEVVFVVDVDEGCGVDVGVVDGVFVVVFVVEVVDGDVGLFVVYDEIVVFCFVLVFMCFMEESLGVGDDLWVMVWYVGWFWSSVCGEVLWVVLWFEVWRCWFDVWRWLIF